MYILSVTPSKRNKAILVYFYRFEGPPILIYYLKLSYNMSILGLPYCKKGESAKIKSTVCGK